MRPKLIHSTKRRNSSSTSQYLLERRKSHCQTAADQDNSEIGVSQVLLAVQQGRTLNSANGNKRLSVKSTQPRRSSFFDAQEFSTDEMMWGPTSAQSKKESKFEVSAWLPDPATFKKLRWVVISIGLICLLYALGVRFLKGNS